MLDFVDRPRLYRRLALGALAVSVAVLLGTALFGIAMPVQWGHYGHHIGEYVMRARGTLRYHTIIPAHWSGPDFPPVSAYYLHHGLLPHQFLTIALFLFGEHLWLVRAIPVAWSVLTLVALFVLVRRHWGHAPAAAAALMYATLPFVAAFSIHYDEGHPALVAFLVAMDAWLRFRHTPRLSLAALTLGGFLVATLSEWTPYFYTTFFVPLAFLIGFSTVDRHKPRFLFLSSTQWLAILVGIVSVLALGFHFWFTRKVGALDDLIGSYHSRAKNPSWEFTIERQKTWFLMYLGRPYLYLFGIWGGLLLLRLVTLRARARDVVAFTLLAGWLMLVWFFPVGVDTHSYRIMPLSACVPLVVASLLHDARLMARWFLSKLPLVRRGARALPSVGVLAGYGWLFHFQLPKAHDVLLAARATAGTIEFEGYSPHLDAFLFADRVRDRTPRDALVLVHPNLGVRPEFMSVLDREIATVHILTTAESWPTRRHLYVAWNNDWLSSVDRTAASRIVARHGAFILGSYFLSDLTRSEPVAECFRFQLGRASPSYRFFVSREYPPYEVEPWLSPATAAWLGGLGVRVTTRDTVPAPAETDVSDLVGYLNYVRARNDNPQVTESTEQKLRQILTPGGQAGPLHVVGWRVGSDRATFRLVLKRGGEGSLDRDYRVAFVTVPTSARGSGAQAAGFRNVEKEPPVVRTPSPERPEDDVDFWKDGYLHIWDVPLQDLSKGTYEVRFEVYERNKGIPDTLVQPPAALRPKSSPPAPTSALLVLEPVAAGTSRARPQAAVPLATIALGKMDQ